MPTSLSDNVLALLAATVEEDGVGKNIRLARALHLLGKWRSTLIQNELLKAFGPVVLAGPFQGMKLRERAAEGCFAPKLLGSYERALHPLIERLVSQPYDCVINIGSAEGYYAVGLARRMPGTRVLAYDIDEKARGACRELAAINGIPERVEVGGRFDGADFARLTGQRVLVVCDIEGSERELLDPDAWPALRELDILVEAHDCFIPGLSGLLADRFKASHRVERFDAATDGFLLPPVADKWSELDRLLATWEWRAGPTPWLFMKAPNPQTLAGAGESP